MIAGLQAQWGAMNDMLKDDSTVMPSAVPSAVPPRAQTVTQPQPNTVQPQSAQPAQNIPQQQTAYSANSQYAAQYQQQVPTTEEHDIPSASTYTAPTYTPGQIPQTYTNAYAQQYAQQPQYAATAQSNTAVSSSSNQSTYTTVSTVYEAPPLPNKSANPAFNVEPVSTPTTSADDGEHAILLKKMHALKTANVVKDQAIKQNRTAIDIAFILDLTKSMDPWLDETRLKIRQITQTLAVRYPQSIARVAFIGYKDFDKNSLSPYYVVHDFDTADRILEKIEGIQCNGGDDFCEDVLGAFAQVSSLNWKAKTRLVIFVADAPAHHEYFHDCGAHNDRFHNSNDPAGRGPHTAEDLMRYMANNEIEIHAFKIPVMGLQQNVYKTDKMHLRFKEILGRFGAQLFVHDLDAGPETFLPNVLRAVTSSVTRSLMR
ncbi:Heat shock 70 kDa protein 12A [Nowakowskiella sp. JEL0407]|nr:Heat shock 70 kDa protein 12A [Nowakowskiella sp. JEL0407]